MLEIEGQPVSASSLAAGGNDLLAVMAEDDLAFVAARARRQRLALGAVLSEAHQAAEFAFFVESGVASVVKSHNRLRQIEICLIGPEGFSGAAIVLADGRWPYRTYAQVDQLTAIALPAADLRLLLAASPEARRLIDAAIHVQMVQIAENLVSASWQQVGPRLARWLLMYRDRVRSHRIEVTHAFMAMMIGAQRTKVTEALHELEAAGAITASRGLVLIRDAGLLRAITDGYYGDAD